MNPIDFARSIRARERAVGYWVVLDDPVATERLARVGYDYVCLDAQHGLMGYEGLRNGFLAIDAGATSQAWVRAASNEAAGIGRALDAGATGVIVPLVDCCAHRWAQQVRPRAGRDLLPAHRHRRPLPGRLRRST
ncbi:aldolase/citrate lyase family protein [Nocardioides bruguierae]|uniref:Aldolase/citrate lyase family protein n=1 Tax=Nocardioides bruguierae TaxID=2945102 RepID=A0A9X2IG32_9ACTN|nr:aldolase/citrate lyase family protein [Nocardioides bruguierae]MCM0622461.1 aldolase/citrate lyase family protein [Nocardioides bruguierae]